MTLADGAALAALCGLVAYAVLGGADFGGGVWDALASGPRRGAQRDAIRRAMGPVWEANHVWLIFVVVVLFSCFPIAWATFATAMSVPLRVALLGIALRGAAFVFRTYEVQESRAARAWGVAFGAASVVTPVALGMTLATVATGALPVGDAAARVTGAALLHPLSLAMGLAALSLSAYTAAVFLTAESDGALREDFRVRALASGALVAAGALLTVPLLRSAAPHLLHGLLSTRALGFVVVGVAAAALSVSALLRGRARLARAATIVQVACIVAGWGAAQHPYLVYPSLTIEGSAAPRGTLVFLLSSLPFGLAVIVPSLAWLLRVFKGRDAERR